MTKGLVSEFTKPEHLADPYLGAWHVPGLIDQSAADSVIEEIAQARERGQVEGIREDPNSKTRQVFERLIVDLTREHDFECLEKMGRMLGSYVVANTMQYFPPIVDFQIDEVAVQIYPPEAELALGWHRDHPDDKFVVISAVFDGEGDIGFTEKTYEEAKDEGVDDSEIIASIHTRALDVVYFRANGLYEREDGSDIRETHAVTKINAGVPRFTAQYRMEVNAFEYGNTPVNADAPLRQGRLPLIDLSNI